MGRLTTDTPECNFSAALNLFYINAGVVYVRGSGATSDCPDVTLGEYIREIAKAHNVDRPVELLPKELLYNRPETVEDLVALIDTVGWAFAELRARLKRYEDTGLEPEKIERLKPASQVPGEDPDAYLVRELY